MTITIEINGATNEQDSLFHIGEYIAASLDRHGLLLSDMGSILHGQSDWIRRPCGTIIGVWRVEQARCGLCQERPGLDKHGSKCQACNGRGYQA